MQESCVVRALPVDHHDLVHVEIEIWFCHWRLRLVTVHAHVLWVVLSYLMMNLPRCAPPAVQQRQLAARSGDNSRIQQQIRNDACRWR